MLANIDRAIIVPRSPVTSAGRRPPDDRPHPRMQDRERLRGRPVGDVGTDNVPDAYLLQCQWCLPGITRADVADLAVLIGGSDYRIYSIARDDGLIGDMIEAAAEFWKRVQEGIAPDPQSVAEAARKWPRHIADKSLIVDVTVAEACAELETIGQQKKQLEAREDELKTQVMSAFGDAEKHHGQKLATWKTRPPTASTPPG